MDFINICTACEGFKCQQSGCRKKPLEGLQNKTFPGFDVDPRNLIKPGRRIFWICVFAFILYTCGSLLLNVWNKWRTNSVIFGFDDKLNAFEIPFPTVTICVASKFREDAFQYSRLHKKILRKPLTEKERYYFEAIAQLCVNNTFGDRELKEQLRNGTNFIKTLDDMAPMFRNNFEQCSGLAAGRPCKTFFHPILTEEGICYNFNGLDPNDIYRDEVFIHDKLLSDDYKHKYRKADWDLENGYNSGVKTQAFPFRLIESGEKIAITMKFKHTSNANGLVCGPGRHGRQVLKVVLTTPGEVPEVSQKYIPIPIRKAVHISMTPELIRISEGLRDYPPMRRHCYFQNERYLRYFKLYSQNKCQMECLTNYTLKLCGCVKFSMPKTLDTPVCGGQKIHCMSQAADDYETEEFRRSLDTTEDEFNDERNCNCLPSCTSINYNVKIVQMTQTGEKADSQSQFSISYNEAQYLTTKHSELDPNITDVLGNCGLLGLLTGISILTIMEIMYLCTVRMLGYLRMGESKMLQCLQDKEHVPTESGIVYKEL